MAMLDVLTNRGLDADGFLYRVIDDGGYSSWSSSRIVLRETVHGDAVYVMGSGFTWNSEGQVIGGTVTGWRMVADGGYVGTVSGVKTDANDFFAAIEDVWNLHSGAALDDILYGSMSWDAVGGAGADVLMGGDFADTLTGGAGNDTLNGGGGYDLVDYSIETGPLTVVVDLAARTATDTFGNRDRLNSIENILGTDGSDDLRGTDGRNAIAGSDGNDVIYGRGNVDGLYGGYGGDTIYGGDGNDLVKGDADADRLYGDAGNDRIYGGSGNDALVGGYDSDTLYGDSGNDRLSGGTGRDQLWGGTGSDTLTGGSSADLFRFSTGFGRDTITDFRWSEADKVDLRGVSGVHSYADIVKLTDAYGDAVAVMGSDRITFTDVSWADLRASDFLFV